MNPFKWNWKWQTLAVIFLVIGSWAWFNFTGPVVRSGKPVLEHDKATTYILSPVDENGDIDYVAALNNEFSLGVTKNNNALVKFMEAFGPNPEQYIQDDAIELPSLFFEKLGVTYPAKNGKYFLDSYAWAKLNYSDANSKQNKDFIWKADFAKDQAWDPKQFPKVNQWLDENEPPLKSFLEGCRRTNFFHPIVGAERPAILNSNSQILAPMRNMALTLSARANRSLHLKDYGLWKRDVLAIYQSAHLLSQGSTLMDNLSAIAIDNIGNAAVACALDSQHWNEKQLADLQSTIRNLSRFQSMQQCLELSERFSILDVIQTKARYRGVSTVGLPALPSRLPVNMSEAAKVWNTVYEKYVRAIQTPDPNLRLERIKNLDQEFEAEMAQPSSASQQALAFVAGANVRGRVAGQFLLSIGLPGFLNVEIANLRAQQRRELCVFAIALERFRLASGTHPKSLTELKPKYLPTIPKDIFGNDFIYKKTVLGYMLHSKGPNGKDDKGIADHRRIGDDFIWGTHRRQTLKEFIDEYK